MAVFHEMFTNYKQKVKIDKKAIFAFICRRM